MEFNLDTTIEELFEKGVISRRTLNCLSHEGYSTLIDVTSHIDDPTELLRIRNFGRKSFTEMNSVILKLKESFNEFQLKEIPSAKKKIYDCIEDSFNTVFAADDKLCIRIKTLYDSFLELHTSIMADLNCALKIETDFTLEENISMRKLYLNFIFGANSNLEKEGQTDTHVYRTYKRLETELNLKISEFSLFEKAHYFMRIELHKYIEETYKNTLQKKLSVRAMNFAKKHLPSFEDIILYFDKPLSSYSQLCPGKSMKKTLAEIYRFNQFFEKIYLNLCDITDEELIDLKIKSKYPFLISRQRNFVKQFITEFKYAPLFYIIHEYLRISDDRNDKIFSLKYGLFDNKKRDVTEIASIYNLSQERVRQILKRSIQRNLSSFQEDIQNYNKIFQLPFIYDETLEYKELILAEHLSFSFDIFAAILTQLADYNLIEINDYIIAIKNDSTKYDTQINDYIFTLKSLSNSRFSKDTILPLKNILKSKSNEEDLVNLIKSIASKGFNLNIKDDSIIFPQNYIDVSEELYQFLLEKGEPMTLYDLFENFKRKYPEHPYTDPMQIKSFLYNNNHIRSIGKQSLYGLDFWKNIYFGSIRDLIYELIDNSEEPIDIGQIYEQVIEYFPNTNIKSIASSIQSDTLNRFISFEDGFFGIKGKEYRNDFSERLPKKRYSFEERMNSFKEFVETYKRFPLSNGGEEESSLRRWYYNVENCIIEAPSEKILDQYLQMIEVYKQKGIPTTGHESEFLKNCEAYQEFINSNYKLPTVRDSEDLYWWFKRSLDNYDSYVDNRRKYLTALLDYIHSLGFSLQI